MFSNKNLLAILLTLSSLSSFSQESKTFKLYGFARTDYIGDSRKMVANVQDLFSLYPMYKNLNAYGEDLNDVTSASMMSITSRIGLDFSSPAGIFNAKTAMAKIETDFGGSPTYMLLRIRQAYAKIIWDNSELLIGQTWHPLFVQATQPNVLSLNTGSPFQPFNRSPQVRFDYQMNKIKLTAAAIYQMMYASQGPDGPGTSYQKNAIVPDLYVGIEYKKNGMLIGLGGDYKSIMPQRYFVNDQGVQRVNHKVLSTPSIMAYGAYINGEFTAKAKVILGQNLTEHNIIGGYVITPDNKYIPYNSLSSFVHFNYGKTHQFGVLLGYTENLGSSKSIPLLSSYYGFGIANANLTNEKIVGNIFRITPTYSYNIKNWRMGAEVEYTNAAWGARNKAGKIINLDRSNNFRLYALLMYTF